MLRTALATLALVLTACASKSPPPPVPPVCPTPPKVATQEDMRRFQDAILGCRDQACRDKVIADFDGYLVSFEVLVGDAGGNAESAAALVELQVIADRACACADAACARRIQEEFETWATASEDVQGSQTEADQAGLIAERISECMVKVMTGGDDESELED